MKRKRKPKQTISTTYEGYLYFPQEVLTEVLANLPVKSLLRFRCVSKLWRDIIDNPNFISMHLNYYKKNKNTHVSTLHWAGRRGLCFTTRSSDTFRRCEQLFTEVWEPYRPRAGVNGLILLSHFAGHGLRLWNPSVRKCLRLPPCPLSLNYREVFTVGFALLSSEYKVVVFQFHTTSSRNSKPSFAIYGLGDGCWRTSTKGMDVVDWEHCHMKSESLSTNGAVYWLMDCYLNDFSGDRIVSFDFGAEEFSFLELPGDSPEKMLRFLFLLGESVAVLDSINMCIWVMDKDGGKELWTKWYSGDISLDEYNFFPSQGHGKILYVEQSSVLLILLDGKVMWYNIKSHKIRHVARSIPQSDMYIYVESLLLCRGFEGQTLVSFPEKGEQ